MARPKLRDAALRARMLAAALALLEDEGVAAVTTRAVAVRAGTSAPAIYEFFGDKAGLVRALFFEGFRLLGDAYAALPPSGDAIADVHASARAFRRFALARPALFQVMFSQPFAAFAPTPQERALGTATRSHVAQRIARLVRDGHVDGDTDDLEHAFVAVTLGLATQETGGWLGSSEAACDRRWHSTLDALMQGWAR